MNKFREKIGTAIIALFGACNRVFGVFIPIAVALLLINTVPDLTNFNSITLLVVATMSALFRAVSIWVD